MWLATLQLLSLKLKDVHGFVLVLTGLAVLVSSFNPSKRGQRMNAAKQPRTIAGNGEPPSLTRCVRTAPHIVQTSNAAPTGTTRGTRSRIAEASSIVPVA